MKPLNRVKPIKAWALLYPQGREGRVMQIFTNCPARIYATRSAAIEMSNNSYKVIKVLITPITKSRRRTKKS